MNELILCVLCSSNWIIFGFSQQNN